MREGAEYFTSPTEPAQRRYEALRAYFVDELPAVEVGRRFGYSGSTVHQLAAELRAGRSEFFGSSKPGPKGPRKSGRVRDRVIALRAEDRSVTATPDRLWRHFLDTTGTVHVEADHVRVDLALRTYTPVLIDAGFPELETTIPWWNDRKLRFGFPPR